MKLKQNIITSVLLLLFTCFFHFSYGTYNTEEMADGRKKRSEPTPEQITNVAARQIGRSINGWGVGVKLGDPLGLSLKYYMKGGSSWEFLLGRSSYRLENYQDDFKDDINHANDHSDEYIAINDHSTYSFIGNFIQHYQWKISRIRGLYWYFGGGAQMRLKTFEYVYDEYYPLSGGGIRTERKTTAATDIDLGADFLLGVEYRLRSPNIAFSLDVGGFVEFIDDSFEAAS